MMKNVLQWLEQTAERLPEKEAFRGPEGGITFRELKLRAERIGTALLLKNLPRAPIAVMMGRNVRTIESYLGIVYSGRVYAPIDIALPRERVEKMLRLLKPAAVITEEALRQQAEGFSPGCPVFTEEELTEDFPEEKEAVGKRFLRKIREEMTETDPLYIIFTSGSSGNPKAVITGHHALMNYISAYTGVMGITEEDRLGCQSPLDYIAAVRDIYVPLLTGASTCLIPKEFFMQPEALIRCMNEEAVTCVGWSVSAITVLTSLGICGMDEHFESLKKICFSGSVMPGKVLSRWQKLLPETRFVNQYGPTEATASCTYYPVDHMVEEGESLPIGRPYENYRILILKEDGTEAAAGEEGEICVGGPVLALGYYRDPERTRAAFTENPLSEGYEDRIYRTGDIGVRRPDGLLEFRGRRDRQVKHMGHRVELDEIEAAAQMAGGLQECAALYQPEKEVLWLFYTGSISSRELVLFLREKLPGFMVPRKVKQQDALPKLPNGKIDFTALKGRI